nr:hypothetical protein [Tanacetum cinerariifolium]
MHDSDESVDYESMLEDDLRSVSGFENADFDDTQENDVSHSDHTFPNHNAFDERLSLPNHLDHICEEVSSLHSNNHRIFDHSPKLFKALKCDMGKSVTTLVKSSMKEVRDDLKSQAKSLRKFCLDAQKHLLKPTEQQKSIQEFTNRLFKTTSLIFSPTPPKESTPPKDSSKGKAVAMIEELVNELVKYQGEGVAQSSYTKSSPEKWTEHEAKKAKMMEEYKHQISFRADTLPITKISYEKRLRFPPPAELATFGLTAEEKNMKMTELIKEIFVTENVRVDEMDRNLIPPSGIMPIQGPIINKPESGIFFMNGNTDIGFQRESEFHLTPIVELVRLQRQIKVDSEIARDMFSKINYVIEAGSDFIKARKIIEKNLDNVD